MTSMENLYQSRLSNICVKDIKVLSKGCEILLLQKDEGIKISFTTSEESSLYDDKIVQSIDCIDFKLLVLEI